LARLARVGSALLNPVELRHTVEQADLFVIRARAVLVEARTMLINFARGITKTMGVWSNNRIYLKLRSFTMTGRTRTTAVIEGRNTTLHRPEIAA
jgi:hypothetical protein